MRRRTFLKATAATSASVIAAPAIASNIVHWNMVTSWPRNLPGPGVSAQHLVDRINFLSNGRLQIKLHAAGELVPWNGVFDAVAEGTADLFHGTSAYWGAKSKAIMLFCTQPFGLLADEQVGWLKHGGGQELYDAFYAQFGLKPFMCGNSGQQWHGWFRKEIHSLDDMKGLKYRNSGLASEVFAKLGVAVQTMSAPEMFQALQTGALDAGEFIGPWSDSAMGFHQVAKYYYLPGLGEPSSAEECVINKKSYDALPQDLKALVSVACDSMYNQTWTEYTTNHARALPKLINEHGVLLRELPEDVIKAAGEASKEVLTEIRDQGDTLSKKVVDNFREYHALITRYKHYTVEPFLKARSSVFKA